MLQSTLSRLLVRLLLNVDLQWTYCFITINVSIDCNWNKVSSLEEKYALLKIKTTSCLVCVLFAKIIVCKDDVFLALKLQIMNENIKFCTMMYRMATRNGIDCCNNPTLLICITTTHFDWMGLNCCI